LEEALAVEGSFLQAHLYSVASQGVRAKPFSSHPVEQAEVERLGQLAIVLVLVLTTGKALGRERVEIAAFGVGTEHLTVARDLGSEP
jgi:hypothetical protein